MKFFLSLSIIFVTLEPIAFADGGGGSRVYEGYPIKITDAPWMVFVDYPYVKDAGKWTYGCGGSIVGDKHILTAGHCVYEDGVVSNASQFEIRVGSADKAKGGYTYKVSEVHLHPKYEPEEKFHDMAILKVFEKIQTNGKTVKKIRLDSTKGNYKVGESVKSMGWGENPEHPTTRQMYRVDLNVKSSEECAKAWGGSASDYEKHFVCAFGPNKGDVCSGDSGGPLIHGKDNIQIGTVSYGGDCPQKHHNRPGAYSKIADNLAWIKSVISGGTKDDDSYESYQVPI